MANPRWLSCKIGTHPARARVHGRDVIEPGKWIRIQECTGDRWHSVRVTRVDRNEEHAVMYFMADR